MYEKLIERALLSLDASIDLKLWSTLDPEPKPDKAILTSRIEEIRRNTQFLKEYILSRNLSELDYRDILAMERAIHRIAEAILDICRQLVAVYSLGLVESYGMYPKRLAEAGKMPKDLALEVSKLAGLRNILVHRYIEIKVDLLYKVAKEIVDNIARKFIYWVKSVDP